MMIPLTETQEKTDLVFIGPFPDPVHGQSIATDRLYKLLLSNGLRVKAVDTGEGGSGLIGKLRRTARLAGSIPAAMRPARWLYLSANSGAGLIVSALQARLGRAMGHRIIVHHHVYRYIGAYDRRMQQLADAAGPGAIHLANCDKMAELLKDRYPGIGRCMGYGNAGFVEPELMRLPIGDKADESITLGHMSNLSVEKGVGRVVETFVAARDRGLKVKLLLAGPCSDAESQKIVDDVQRRFPADARYLGPVYADDKTAFFQATDVFLFPTEYKNEAGPIVLLEALAAGIPCVSTEQCCIPSMLAGGGGLALEAGSPDAIARTVDFIADFIAAPLARANDARKRFETLMAEQAQREKDLVQLLR